MNKNTYKELRLKLDFSFKYKAFAQQIITDAAMLLSVILLFGTPYAVLNVFLIPAFMFRQFSILHEAVHGLSYPNARVNDLIGTIAGVFCLTPYAAWKAAHLKHHYWTGNLEQDPTFAILKTFEQSSQLKKNVIEFTWRNGIPFLGFLQHLGFWVFSLKNHAVLKNALSSFVTLGVYAMLLSQVSLMVGAISVVGIGLYLRMYEDMIVPQHVGMYSDDLADHHVLAWEQPEVTRSWYLSPVLEKYVVLNMNYHTEHHLFPDLPWYELKKAHGHLLEKKELLNVVSLSWMSEQRKIRFAEVIVPVPSHKRNAA